MNMYVGFHICMLARACVHLCAHGPQSWYVVCFLTSHRKTRYFRTGHNEWSWKGDKKLFRWGDKTKWSTSSSGEFAKCNPVFSSLLGCSPSAIMGSCSLCISFWSIEKYCYFIAKGCCTVKCIKNRDELRRDLFTRVPPPASGIVSFHNNLIFSFKEKAFKVPWLQMHHNQKTKWRCHHKRSKKVPKQYIFYIFRRQS